MVQGQGRSAQSDRLESQLVFTLGDGPAPADFAGDVVATGKNAKTQSSQTALLSMPTISGGFLGPRRNDIPSISYEITTRCTHVVYRFKVGGAGTYARAVRFSQGSLSFT